nr:phosphotransferase [Bifidobacterium aesculapii]
MLAALTSAALPSVVVAGVFPGMTRTDGIDQAQVRDVTGKTYDVYASNTEEGRRKLAARVKAAKTLAAAREPGGLGFALDRVLGFAPGTDPKGPTGDTAVMVAMHQDGVERQLDLLTLDDCAAMGTAIGAIHRLNPSFLTEAGYPAYVTEQIRGQLTAWIARLDNAGHVPPEITSSWAKIMETEGLWAFRTCLVHGGFEDGDVRFSGSTITAVNNWQTMQVNDPARDLAWIFSKLDEAHRNAVLTAYGRMMGNRLDGLIMLRANLWVQMEQVGDFIQAVKRADSQQIIRFKAQVDRLAHQLARAARAAAPKPTSYRPGARRGTAAVEGATGRAQEKPPSTITVGTLLEAGERRRAEARTVAEAQAGDADRTGSADIVAAGEYAPQGGAARSGAAGTGSTKPQHTAYAGYRDMPAPDSSETMALRRMDDGEGAPASIEERHTINGMPMPPTITPMRPLSRMVASGMMHALGDAAKVIDASEAADADRSGEDAGHVAAGEGSGVAARNDAGAATAPADATSTDTSATVVIPLLEREERALRDARAGLDFDDETFDDQPDAAGEYHPSEEDETPKVQAEHDAPQSTPRNDDDVSSTGAPDAEPDDDTPSVTPIVVAAPSLAVIASTGTVSDETPEAIISAHVRTDDTDATEDDDTGEARTIPDEARNGGDTPTA